MKKSTDTSALFPNHVKWVNHLSQTIKFYVLVLFVLVSVQAFAQTFPASCTSKDLTLLQATLPADATDRCACEGDRVLVLGIHNGTKSTRTSFGLWGTLVRKGADGNVISSLAIFACTGPIPPGGGTSPSGDFYLNATTLIIAGVPVTPGSDGYPRIHIACGESLDIINMHLAWTSANNNETCDVLYANPDKINPKCGTQDLIHVGIGLDATVTKTNASCTAGGKIKVEPFGGIAPYQVCIGVDCHTVAAGGNYEFTGLDGTAAGVTYTVVITDNMNETDVTKRCTTSKTGIIFQPDAVSAPNATVTSPGCGESTGSATVTSAASGVTYTLEQSGVVIKTANSSGVFSGVAPGTYDLVATKGECTATNDDGVVVQSPPSNPTFSVCIVQPTLCTAGSLTITASGGGSFQYSINGGTTYSAVGANTFNNLKSGDVTSVKVKNGAGCFSGAITCANLVSSCPEDRPARISNTQQIESTESTTTVKAYPNPFSDRVKFMVTSSVAGNGNLEVYNMMGQKVKTVYQGYIAKGTQTFELSLPNQSVGNLVYVLRVGDKKMTGKILQINR
jgi:hypothetical protein